MWAHLVTIVQELTDRDIGLRVLTGQGREPIRAGRLNYLTDPAYRGLYDANPFHAPRRSGNRGLEVVA